MQPHPGLLADGKIPARAAQEAKVILPVKRPLFGNEQYWMLLALERWMSRAGAL